MTKTQIGKALMRALRGGALGLLLLSGAVLPVRAEGEAAETVAPSAAVVQLIATMRIDDVIGQLQVEGLEYGASLEEQMFPGAGGAGWTATVARIYDPEEMKAAFASRLAVELQGKDAAVAKIEEFFASDLGQKVLKLELEARRALMDDETEAAAGLVWSDLDAEGGKRAAMIRDFARVNDLVDSNVMGALNSNLAFYQGMAAGGGVEAEMSEEDLLAEVWGQEPDIRHETENWVYPYLNLAYGSLAEEELQAYIDFSATAEGQVLNTALFAAFDAVFTPISKALGHAAAVELNGQDI